MRSQFLFGTFPYLAATIFSLGIVARLVSLRAGGRDLPARTGRTVFPAGLWWYCTLACILAGHLAGLLIPESIRAWNIVPVRLYILEATGMLLGAACAAGVLRILKQHISRVVGSTFYQITDSCFLAVVLTLVVSGVVTALFYRWGSSWGTLTLTPYVLTVLRGTPAVALVAQMPFTVQLHVFTALTVVALFPFTSPANSLLLFCRKAIDAGCASAIRTLDDAVATVGNRLTGSHLMFRVWPEEED